MSPARLILVGMMGSGKTTIGRLLAAATGWPYADNDELVRATTGREPAAIRAADGEDALHAYESAALLQALEMQGPGIIGAAAWAVEDPVTEALLRDHGSVVWLRAHPETLRARIGSGIGRRVEATDLAWLARLAMARETRYAAVADLVIDVDDIASDAVAKNILRWWARRRERDQGMRVGVIVPQGWTREYVGWEPSAAWARTVTVAQQADRLGFDSIWLFDHFHTRPEPIDAITFESFTSLSALAALTSRVRLGHSVLCTAFRNPALTAKMAATLDVISGGRFELGVGSGWKEDEFRGYGYPFPPRTERLAALSDHLQVYTRMLGPGRATFHGTHASVDDAINEPRGLQRPRLPIMVGGNGPNVTWRLAARHADELNLDGLGPDEVGRALPVIRARCEEIGRDPATLRVSVHAQEFWKLPPAEQPDPIGRLAAYRDAGVDRVITFLPASTTSDEALPAFAAAARAAGADLHPEG